MIPSAQAIFFDLMGTCVDWHTSITRLLEQLTHLDYEDASTLALAWRRGFFDEILHGFDTGQPEERIDITHRRVLDRLLSDRNEEWDEKVKSTLVAGWHSQTAWPDSIEGLSLLRKQYMVLSHSPDLKLEIVLANGTTRLQLDIVRSSGLQFDTLLSSQLLGSTKPDPKMYGKALALVGLEPSQAIMLASHAYDLRAAAKVAMNNSGMKTIYIHRSTEDQHEDKEQLQAEFDLFIDGTKLDGKDGLVSIAHHLSKE